MIYKTVVDVLMTLALLALMGFQFWGDAAHEWIGAGMFVLFILHNALNASWWRTLFKGRYTPVRTLLTAVDLLTLLAVLGLMVSGVILSRRMFAFLPIKGGMSFGRLLHMASSYWGFVLMSLHLGLHWEALYTRIWKKRPGKGWIVPAALTALYGGFAFFKRNLPIYLFLRTQFVFLDFEEPKPLFYLDYLAMMGLFIFLAHYGAKRLKRTKERPAL